MSHQSQNQHFDGHFILNETSHRKWRVSLRFRSSNEVEEIDKTNAVFDLHMFDDGKSNDEEGIEEPDDENSVTDNPNPLPTPSASDLPALRLTPTTSRSAPSESGKTPKWFGNLNLPDIRLSNNYTRFWCECIKIPLSGFFPEGVVGILWSIVQDPGHVCLRAALYYSKSATAPSHLKKRNKLLQDAEVAGNMAFSVVKKVEFREPFLTGSGHEALKFHPVELQQGP